jgi:hypothetical protein
LRPFQFGISDRLYNDGGSSIVAGMISMALLTIGAATLATLVTGQSKQIANAGQKLELMDLKNQLVSLVLNVDSCSCQFDPAIHTAVASSLKFDSAALNIPDINLTELRSGCAFSDSRTIIAEATKPLRGSPTNLKILSVKLINIRFTGTPNEYTGQIEVVVDPSGNTTGLRSVTSELRFLKDPASIAPNNTIKSCMSQSMTNGITTCPTGYLLINSPGTSEAFCIEASASAAATPAVASNRCGSFQPPGFGRAHLCTADQFVAGCRKYPVAGGFGAPELYGTPYTAAYTGIPAGTHTLTASPCGTLGSVVAAAPSRCCLK